MALQDKYAGVINAAKTVGIANLQVTENDGVLRISGSTTFTADKDAVWDALGAIDPNYSASDIQIDVEVTGLAAGTPLTVVTEQSNLNIRKEPSTESSVVGKAAKGETVTLVEQSNAEWWKVKTAAGIEGYAYSRYLKA